MSRYRLTRRRSSLFIKEEYLEALKVEEKDRVAIGWVNNAEGQYKRQARSAKPYRRNPKYRASRKKWSKKGNAPSAQSNESQFWWKQENTQNDNKVDGSDAAASNVKKEDVAGSATNANAEDAAKVSTDGLENNTVSKMPLFILSGFVENIQQSGKIIGLNGILTNDKLERKFLMIASDLQRLKYTVSDDEKERDGSDILIKLGNGNYLTSFDTIGSKKESLNAAIEKLTQSKQIDSIVIEAPDVMEPFQLAEMFEYADAPAEEDDIAPSSLEDLMSVLPKHCILARMISIINLNCFDSNLNSVKTFSQQFASNPARNASDASDAPENKNDDEMIEDANVSQLVIAQIECCNSIILFSNESDGSEASEKAVSDVSSVCAVLNSRANIRACSDASRLLDLIVLSGKNGDGKNLKLFDFDAVEQGLRNNYDEIVSNLDAFKKERKVAGVKSNIQSFVYKARKPFDPWKLYLLIRSQILNNVVFATGKMWIATQNDGCFEWNQCGKMITFEEAERQWLQVLKESKGLKKGGKLEKKLKKLTMGKYGDRRQEIVFVGLKDKLQDLVELEAQLETCLISDDDFKQLTPQEWRGMKDPFDLDVESGDETESEEESDISDLD